MKRCHADTYCKQAKSEKCTEFCIGYVQLQNIYELSNLPKRYQFDIPLIAGQDMESFIKLRDFMDNVVENVEQGRGLVLYSKTKGNGKTSWACKIMNAYFKAVALTNNMRCRGLFLNVPDFLQKIRENFNNPSEETQELIENVQEADLVIWDDIGTENPSDWVRERLYTFINKREAEGLSNIYTSNIPLETLENNKYLGDRIVSRILGQCSVIEFVGGDRRRA